MHRLDASPVLSQLCLADSELIGEAADQWLCCMVIGDTQRGYSLVSKPSWNTAPEGLKRQADAVAEDNSKLPGGFVCAAAGEVALVDWWARRGYYYGPESVRVPALAELERREKAGDAVALARFKASRSLELQFSRMALRRSRALAKWASEPTAAERNAAARAEREEQAKAEALERRATEIMIETERAEHEKRKAAARKQAAKEAKGSR